MNNDLKDILIAQDNARIRNNNDLKNFLEEKYKEQETQYETSTFINWLKESDKELVNFILDLVEKEVEKLNKPRLTKPVRKGIIGTMSINYEYNKALEDISTIINKLRV